MPHISKAQIQAHLAIFQLFWPRGAIEILEKWRFLENRPIFKRLYLGNYWAHRAQPMHTKASWTYFSENYQLVPISWLEKNLGQIFTKNRHFLGSKPPWVHQFLIFFCSKVRLSMGDYSSMRDFVGFCLFVTIFLQKQAQKKLFFMIFWLKCNFLR